MEPLRVFHRYQFHENACGAAVLEMTLKYFGRNVAFSQKSTFKRLGSPEPHRSGNYRISSDDLMELASRRGLCTGWGRVSRHREELIGQLDYFLVRERIPLIACQRYTPEMPLLGHFRVIVAFDRDTVTFHDPCKKTGGPARRLSMNEFVENWQRTGENVTGGVAVWMADRSLQTPLLPDLPNQWRETETYCRENLSVG
jgi:ABC-type bacteriocin/lantibiotic exporter with double-glycine peptidase domain